ncbi:MAG: N-formylglutamate amidohydrolase [Alphaproteobacteria bacterium]|nr:N-formylglutamate amidohydrolase [Alphaproteobacteria bacterium]
MTVASWCKRHSDTGARSAIVDAMDDSAAQNVTGPGLLHSGEPLPYELYNERAGGRLLLVCDHGSNRVPDSLEMLGLSDAELARHIGWDIGAADVTYRLSDRLGAPAVLASYSRLVIDCNRALDHPGLILAESDHTLVPGNVGLSETQRQSRVDEFFEPYHAAIADQIERMRVLCGPGEAPVAVSIHSFTPVFDGIERPWHVGVLWNIDPRLAEPLIARLREDNDLIVGDNEPYSAREGFGHTLETQGDGNGLANALIEIRQDLIDTHPGAAEWAERLAVVLEETLVDEALYRPRKAV